MAIIRAARQFEGSDLSQRTTSYLKAGTRLVDFKNKENGVFLFLLGAYKQDNNGAGVWYKPVRIRDNFGMGLYKEKFAVQPNCPIDYFANKVQTFAPEMAKSRETQDDEGRKRWVYPAWGRTAMRVIYNAALYGDFGAGVHVLDLPSSGGGSVIDEYVRGKQANGEPNPDLTDYENAIALNIKLDLKAKGQPWKIQINEGKKYALPIELADTDYLYNLDEVVNYPNKDELIAKLKSCVPSDVFEKGMDGYQDGDRTVVSMHVPKPAQRAAALFAPPAPVADAEPVREALDDVPMAFEPPTPRASVAPTVTIPKTNSKATAQSVPASNSGALAAAREFLNKK